MFHMLTCFNLKDEISIAEFGDSLARFSSHLVSLDLLHETGPIGRRQRHPIMDTDSERDHEYFFIMSFRDRAQCDEAVKHILEKKTELQFYAGACAKTGREGCNYCAGLISPRMADVIAGLELPLSENVVASNVTSSAAATGRPC